MSSLMTAVLSDVTPRSTSMNEEECLASFDLDAAEISAVEGGWDSVGIVTERDTAKFEDLIPSDFEIDGPSVYERKGFMIVRGQRLNEQVWFVYEPATTGVH